MLPSPDAQGSTKHSVGRFYLVTNNQISHQQPNIMNTTDIRNLASALDYIEKECAGWRIKAHAVTFTCLESIESENGAQVVRPVEYIRFSIYQRNHDEFMFEAPICPAMLIHEDYQHAIMDYARAMVCLINSTPAPTDEEWAQKQSNFVPSDCEPF